MIKGDSARVRRARWEVGGSSLPTMRQARQNMSGPAHTQDENVRDPWRAFQEGTEIPFGDCVA